MSEKNHKAAELSFDLSKQFISLAFAGVAFAIGLSTANGNIASTLFFWGAVILFALSAILGFLFLMRGASDFSIKGDFDIYEKGARIMSLFQIVFVFLGVVLLLWLHLSSVKQNPQLQISIDPKVIIENPGSTVKIKVEPNNVITISGQKSALSKD